MLFTKEENKILQENNISEKVIKIFENHFQAKVDSIVTNKDLDLAIVKIQKEMLEMRNEFNLKMKDLEVKMSGLESNMNKIETRIVWKILAILVSLLSPFYIQLLINIYKIAL